MKRLVRLAARASRFSARRPPRRRRCRSARSSPRTARSTSRGPRLGARRRRGRRASRRRTSRVVWSSVAQDGTAAGGVIPGTASTNPKTSLDLTLRRADGLARRALEGRDLDSERAPPRDLQGGAWTLADLLPNLGFAHAYNPQMLLTHQTVHTLDADGADVCVQPLDPLGHLVGRGGTSQARYAPIFLDEDRSVPGRASTTCPSSSAARGRPRSTGSPARRVRVPGAAGRRDRRRDPRELRDRSPPTSSTSSASPTRTTSASPGDRQRHVAAAAHPGRRRRERGPDRRGAFDGRGLGAHRRRLELPADVDWRDDLALHYIRFDGIAWSEVRSIAYSPEIDYAKAVALVEEMARRN